MTITYTRIKKLLTEDEIEMRFFALVDKLGLGDPTELTQEVVDQLCDNIVLIESFERAGVTLSKTRDIEHWAYFNLASEAKQFAKALTKSHKGYRARLGERIDDSWPVVIRTRSDLRLVSIGRMNVDMCMLALSYNGWYDGFEATIENAAAYNLDAVKGEPMTANEIAGSGISNRPGFELTRTNAEV